MVTHSIVGRSGESSNGVMAIDVSGTARSNVIETHWCTDLWMADATQAVDGLPSNADAGPSDGSGWRVVEPVELAAHERRSDGCRHRLRIGGPQ